MILVVTLNPALDVTHHVTRVDWSGVNRPVAVRARPGGKGLNVARTLHALGTEVLAIGLAGGVTGAAVRSGLSAAGVPAALTGIAGETRRTFAVVDEQRGRTALFNEPGPAVSAAEYQRFLACYVEALPGCAAVVLSGSLPPGLAPDSYAELTGLAAAVSVPVLLDAEGQALLRGAPGRPAIVKPNLAELERCMGRPMSTPAGFDRAAVIGAARELMAAGAQSVVVTLGAAGLLAVTSDGPGMPRRPARRRVTRPAPATPFWPGWRTGWSLAAAGGSGCGTRWRSGPRRRPPLPPVSSGPPTTANCWAPCGSPPVRRG